VKEPLATNGESPEPLRCTARACSCRSPCIRHPRWRESSDWIGRPPAGADLHGAGRWRARPVNETGDLIVFFHAAWRARLSGALSISLPSWLPMSRLDCCDIDGRCPNSVSQFSARTRQALQIAAHCRWDTGTCPRLGAVSHRRLRPLVSPGRAGMCAVSRSI
jgi:hypothetical protein